METKKEKESVSIPLTVTNQSAAAQPPKKTERPKEQDLNSFAYVTPDRSDPNFKGRWVGLGYKITQITNLDDGHNTFHMEFYLYPTWEEKTLIGGEKGKKYALDDLPWEPKIKFKNELGFELMSANVWLQDPATGTIDSQLRFRGTFYEHLELHNFPFDKQDLRIFVDSFYHKENMRFYQRDDRPNSFAAHRFPLSEWSFEEDSVEFRMNTVASGNSYYNYVINCPIRRLHEYYVQNTLLMSFMLLSMGAGTFLFDISTIDNRLNYVVTLALTSVAFKYLMLERLPRVPYSTILDKYLYCLFGLVTLLAVLQIIIGALYDYYDVKVAKDVNIGSLIAFVALSVILHCVALIAVVFKSRFIRDTGNQ